MIKPLLLAVFISTQLMTALAQATPLPKLVRHTLQQTHISQSHVGFVIQRLDSVKNPETSLNASTPFNPASVMKALTTLVALDSLGPAYTFQTRVLVDGRVDDGVLTGNLVIQGGGDPALNLEHFWTLLNEIRSRGIRKINGDVILDNDFFAVAPMDPGAFDGEPLKPYNAVPTALMVNYNAFPLLVSATGKGITAQFDPPAFPIDNKVAPNSKLGCSDWEDGLSFRRITDRRSNGQPQGYQNLGAPARGFMPDGQAAAGGRGPVRSRGKAGGALEDSPQKARGG